MLIVNRNENKTLGLLLNNLERDLLSEADLYHSESPEHIDSYQEVVNYLNDRGSNHKNYKYYASRNRIRSILEDSFLYLSDGTCWNDKYDRENFNPPFLDTRNFGICFSATVEENIAMWMLYGGVDGNGAMINFDKKVLETIHDAEYYECGRFNEDGIFECLEIIDKNDVEFSLIDVLYFSSRKNNDSKTLVKHDSKSKAYDIESRIFPKIAQLAKHKSWSYENEVRLVASVNKLKLGTKWSRISFIKIPISVTNDFIANRVFDSPVSDEFGIFRDSELVGTVDWDLCAGCEYKASENRN